MPDPHDFRDDVAVDLEIAATRLALKRARHELYEALEDDFRRVPIERLGVAYRVDGMSPDA